MAIDNKKSKTIDLYSAYTEKNYWHLFNQSKLSNAMGYGVGTCAILFTMNWGIHQGIVLDLNTPMLSKKKAVQAYNGTNKVMFYRNVNKHT